MAWEVVAHGFGLAEAPTVDHDETLLFSDVLGGGVYRVDASGLVTTVVPKRRGVGGIAVHADGGFVCSGRDVIHVREGQSPRTVASADDVAGWNDLSTDAAGAVYVGALRFAVFDPAAEVVAGELWRVEHDAAPTIVVGDVLHANGVACSPDGTRIYLSDTRRREIVVLDVERSERDAFDVSSLGDPDGLALDEHGALWVALLGGGIARFTPAGALDRRIEPPSSATTSVCFAGRDLYVTTGGHTEHPELRGCVLRTTVDVAGTAVPPARV